MEWGSLAQSYELTGGLIRNAVLSALALAIREQTLGDPLLLTRQHLAGGAKLQLRYVSVVEGEGREEGRGRESGKRDLIYMYVYTLYVATYMYMYYVY